MSAGDPRGGGGGGRGWGVRTLGAGRGAGAVDTPPQRRTAGLSPWILVPGRVSPRSVSPSSGLCPPPPSLGAAARGSPPLPGMLEGPDPAPHGFGVLRLQRGWRPEATGTGAGTRRLRCRRSRIIQPGLGWGKLGGDRCPERSLRVLGWIDTPPPPRPGPPLPGPCPPPPPRPLAAELANAHPPHARAATGCGHRPQPLCPPVSPADPSPCGPRGTCEPPQRGSGCWRGSQRQGPPGAGRSWGAVARASPPAHEGPAALLVPDALACHRLSSSPRQAGGAGRSRPAAAAALSTFLAAGGLFSLPGAPAPGQVFTEQPALLWALPRQHRTGVPLRVPSAPRRVSGMGSAPRAPYPLPWPWHPGQCPVPWRRVHSCASVWLPPFLGMLLQGYFE